MILFARRDAAGIAGADVDCIMERDKFVGRNGEMEL